MSSHRRTGTPSYVKRHPSSWLLKVRYTPLRYASPSRALCAVARVGVSIDARGDGVARDG